MSIFKLSLSYLKKRFLNTFLNVLLLSFGIATVVVLLLFSYQFEENLYSNAEGVDAVIGAQGSPTQLILSGIFHIDSPTGNIKLSEARELMEHPAVRSAIPLALGDNFQGYRIVGTTSEYHKQYEAELRDGDWWAHKFEVVVGADVAENTGLTLGDVILSSHGFSESGHVHDDHELIVTGVMERTGTVLDRLILTAVETMWGIHHTHDDHDDHDHEGAHSEHHAGHQNNNHDHNGEHSGSYDHEESGLTAVTDESFLNEEHHGEEITVMLVKYANPLAAAQFPRFVNEQTSMQAAAPAVEITRLLNLLGVGIEAIRIFAIVLIIAALLGIFIAMLNSMKDRKYDLAIMRSLGGSRWKLFSQVILEGIIISILGGLLGLLLGHAAVGGVGILFEEARQFALSGSIFIPEELWVLALAIGIGIIASIVPAVQAYRTDIAETLSKA